MNWKGMDYRKDAFERLVAVDKAGALREFEDQAASQQVRHQAACDTGNNPSGKTGGSA